MISTEEIEREHREYISDISNQKPQQPWEHFDVSILPDLQHYNIESDSLMRFIFQLHEYFRSHEKQYSEAILFLVPVLRPERQVTQQSIYESFQTGIFQQADREEQHYLYLYVQEAREYNENTISSDSIFTKLRNLIKALEKDEAKEWLTLTEGKTVKQVIGAVEKCQIYQRYSISSKLHNMSNKNLKEIAHVEDIRPLQKGQNEQQNSLKTLFFIFHNKTLKSLTIKIPSHGTKLILQVASHTISASNKYVYVTCAANNEPWLRLQRLIVVCLIVECRLTDILNCTFSEKSLSKQINYHLDMVKEQEEPQQLQILLTSFIS